MCFQVDLSQSTDKESDIQSQRRRVKRFSVFDSSFLRDIMDILGGEGVGLGLAGYTPTR